MRQQKLEAPSCRHHSDFVEASSFKRAEWSTIRRSVMTAMFGRRIAFTASTRSLCAGTASTDCSGPWAGTHELAPDPYDRTLVEVGSDPALNRLDKEQRVRAGQRRRARSRRTNENMHRHR
jgi:hypothetical protein